MIRRNSDTIASQHRAGKPEQMGFSAPTAAVVFKAKDAPTATATDSPTVAPTAAAYRMRAIVAHDGKAKQSP